MCPEARLGRVIDTQDLFITPITYNLNMHTVVESVSFESFILNILKSEV